jgi:hypothetical protein
VQRGHAREAFAQLLGHLRFARDAREVQVLGRMPADDVDQDRVVAAQDRLDLQQVVGRAVRRVAGEFAERPFVDSCGRVDHAFEHDLGVRRHAQAVARRAHDLERRAEQPAGDVALVDAERQARRRASMKSGCAPITIATGIGCLRSIAICSSRHRSPRECRLVASSVFECGIERW